MKSITIACVTLTLVAGCARQSAGNLAPTQMLPQIVPAAVSSKIVYAFRHRAFPHARLLNVGGTLYGTTTSGGLTQQGYVYSVTRAGTEKLLYSFKGGADGAQPQAGLIDVAGTLYGTTYLGGGSSTCRLGCGTVFSITTSGTEKVVYSFTGGADGQFPAAALINSGGTLYGTTYVGGGGSCYIQGSRHGCGTVFSVTTSGTERVVYPFNTESDGEFPKASVIAYKGALYGTTYLGGLDAQGTVFRISASGQKTTLHNFGAGTDGANPEAPLFNINGTLYGTTLHGGNGRSTCEYRCGTVFSITTGGKETVLHSFNSTPDGAYPGAGFIEVNGLLYGTTIGGGANNAGTIFSTSLTGKESVVSSFAGKTGGADPEAALIQVLGTLYGTTYSDGLGLHCCGTVFSLTP